MIKNQKIHRSWTNFDIFFKQNSQILVKSVLPEFWRNNDATAIRHAFSVDSFSYRSLHFRLYPSLSIHLYFSAACFMHCDYLWTELLTLSAMGISLTEISSWNEFHTQKRQNTDRHNIFRKEIDERNYSKLSLNWLYFYQICESLQ